MVEFKLIARGVTSVRAGRKEAFEQFYEYEAVVDNRFARVKFHTHPTKAWCWQIMFQNADGRPFTDRLLTAFVEAGLKRGEKSFDEAIRVLEVS